MILFPLHSCQRVNVRTNLGCLGLFFDQPAFTTCVSHGILLGDDGAKMSKSLRNYPDVSAVLDRDGADAMRWFLLSSPVVRGGNLMVTNRAIRDTVRQVLLPLWNTWYRPCRPWKKSAIC